MTLHCNPTTTGHVPRWDHYADETQCVRKELNDVEIDVSTVDWEGAERRLNRRKYRRFGLLKDVELDVSTVGWVYSPTRERSPGPLFAK